MYCQGKDLTMSPIKFNINGVLHYTNHLGLSFHLYRNQSIDMHINQLPAFYMGRTFVTNGLKKVTYIIIQNVTMMFHLDVPKYLDYIIQLLA